MWVVMKFREELPVSVEAGTYSNMSWLPLSGAADGCCGCLLVFNTKEDAEKYADGVEIFQVQIVGEGK